jgi:hypothetical protein
MKIHIDEIQKITLLLLSKVVESKGNEIEIEGDYYWDIASDEIYNPYLEPENISLGQLSDDIKELNRLLQKNDAVPYDIKRLSNILKVISLENQTAF